MSKVRRTFNRELKIRVIREIEAGTPAAQVARHSQVHPNVVSKWGRQYRANPETAFCGGSSGSPEDLTGALRLAELERMVGRLTMENAFLKKVLQRLESVGALPDPRSGAR